MAKKATPKSAAAPKTPAARPAVTPPTSVSSGPSPLTETPVRKTVVPKTAPFVASAIAKKAAVPVTYERIAERAYFISQSGNGGSEHDNWVRAENELKHESL